MRWSLELVVLVGLAGCSFATRGPPRDYNGRTEPDCTTSQTLPVIDTTAAIVAGVLAVPLILTPGDGCSGNEDCHDLGPGIAHGFGALFLVIGGFYALGAYAGFTNVSDCKAAITKYGALHQRPANSVAP